MISLTKKTDYALIALAHLASQPGRMSSAREMAEARSLPVALLMNILKELQHHGMLRSTRGVNGGYEIATDLSTVSLHDLIVVLEGPVKLVECAGADADATENAEPVHFNCRVSGNCAVRAPLEALHHRLIKFLKDVRLSEIVQPGSELSVEGSKSLGVVHLTPSHGACGCGSPAQCGSENKA